MECPSCDGRGCVECGDSGRILVDGCPVRVAGARAFEIISFAELAAKGLAPRAGGALDQTQSFLDAARFVWGEEAHWKARLTRGTTGE